jgi:hypothetical protein
MDLPVVVCGIAKRGYIDLTCAVTGNVSVLLAGTQFRQAWANAHDIRYRTICHGKQMLVTVSAMRSQSSSQLLTCW